MKKKIVKRGSIVKRYEGSYSVIINRGRDPVTGKRKQQWFTVKGTEEDAQDKLNELLKSMKDQTFVEPQRMTLIEWLRAWLEESVKPPLCRRSTFIGFTVVVERHVSKSAIAAIPLQKLRATHIRRWLGEMKASPASIRFRHGVIRQALNQAVKDRLVVVNVAKEVGKLPSLTDESATAREHCWSPEEARRFLEAAQRSAPQVAAFFALALDSGARKMELFGLTWSNIDLDAGRIDIIRQMTAGKEAPTFGPTKTGRTRVVSIDFSTVALLRAHRRTQAELKLKNRMTYRDFDLVFAKEDVNIQTPRGKLGQPLCVEWLSRREFDRLTTTAGVRRIKFHGLRHTSASLLVQAGESVRVVADRLGHADVAMTLNTYTHAAPGAQQAAAKRLGAVLYG